MKTISPLISDSKLTMYFVDYRNEEYKLSCSACSEIFKTGFIAVFLGREHVFKGFLCLDCVKQMNEKCQEVISNNK